MKSIFKFQFLFLSILTALSSCLKFDNEPPIVKIVIPPKTCDDFKNLHIKKVDTFTCGDGIYLTADTFPGATYDWKGPDGFFMENDQDVSITSYANIYHRGWYVVTIKFNNCPPIYDSIYINVKLPQGTPNCSPVNNIATYKNGTVTFPTKNFNFITSDTFSNYFRISASSPSAGNFSLNFNKFWKYKKLESGIYYTTKEDNMFDKYSLNKVYVYDINNSSGWDGEENKPIYVSYVGGKLTFTLCNILFYSPGAVSNTEITTKITVP